MEQGWIKLHRQTLENQFLMKDNNAYVVFTKLLLLVSQKSGEYTTGRFALAEHVNLKPNTLYSVLVRLESQKLINITSNNKYSIIRICNWSKYQTTGNTTHNNTATTRQQPDNNTATLNKNEEGKNKEIVSKDTKVPTVKTATADINEMFDYWQETVGYPLKQSNKKQRYACSNLLKRYGKEGFKKLIVYVNMAHQDKYGSDAGRISDFTSLQYNENALNVWLKKQVASQQQGKGKTYKI